MLMMMTTYKDYATDSVYSTVLVVVRHCYYHIHTPRGNNFSPSLDCFASFNCFNSVIASHAHFCCIANCD